MNADLPAISAEDAQRLLEEGAVLLDVREPEEWDAGHAPGARWIPLGQLVERVAELGDGAESSAPIVAVCRSGGRSSQATAFLIAQGRDARNLSGGMQAWEAGGLPVVNGSGAPGSVI
ncbi:MAG: rhodanese-like domain-containing protein [Acidimicrobiales bacterium]